MFINARKARWCLTWALGLLLAFSVFHPGRAAELKRSVVRVGFSHSAFQGVNRNDAEAAFKVFLINVGRRHGYDLHLTTQIFPDVPSFEAALRERRVELAVIDAWTYVGMDIHEVMQPYFVPLDKTSTGYRYLLLTRQNGRPNTLADLRDKEILVMNAGTCTLAATWLETLLMGNRIGEPGRFLGKMEVVSKPTATVLPVFFGNKPACVIDAGTFEIMKELNPQLGAKLEVVATSEPLVNHVICLAKSGWPSETNKQDMIRGLRELDQETDGQQILTLFKVGRLVPFQETHLDTVRKLRMTYEQLRKGTNP